MGRVPRIQIENTLYFITSRGDHEQNIFADKQDYEVYTSLLKKCREKYDFKLFAFLLLDNQITLLIEAKKDATISQIMHALNSSYTKHFSARHHKTGHLFQERYRMVLLEKEPYLLIASAYIHMSPVRLALVKHPADYRYSSCASYLDGASAAMELKDEAAEMKTRLAGSDYAAFLAATQKDDMENFGREVVRSPVLGSEEFIKKVEAAIESQKAIGKEGAGGKGVDKRFILIGSTVILFLGIFTIYFYGKSLVIKERLKHEIQEKDTEIMRRLGVEKERIVKDIDEKYRADMVSYGAMAKRLEVEKKKTQELEKELKGGKR